MQTLLESKPPIALDRSMEDILSNFENEESQKQMEELI